MGGDRPAGAGPPPREFAPGPCYMGRIPKGADLVTYLDRLVREHSIGSGFLGLIGVVQRARLGFLDTETGRYVITEIDGHREVASCVGDVSLRDGSPAIHAHAVLSDQEGRATGGHLLEGTVAHYIEFWISSLVGTPFERGLDPETNVTGWVR